MEQVTKTCLLEDCEQKAAVVYFAQEALKNTTNAYLAYVAQQQQQQEEEPVVFTSQLEFVQRAELFADTLQQVLEVNANLAGFYVSHAITCVSKSKLVAANVCMRCA